MHQANLTRFGPQVIDCSQGETVSFSGQFNAVDGPAKLLIQGGQVDSLSISINEVEVVSNLTLGDDQKVDVALNLLSKNTLTVNSSGAAKGSVTLRITQITQADLGLLRQGYFGLNTTDIEKQREFYKMLGFIGEIYPAGPETSTTFARSLGFEDNYLIHVSLHSLQNPPEQPFVDTVQFRGASYREEPPYAKLNHIGMAYATYATNDLDGMVAYMKSNNVEFISTPATAPNGERFVYFKEQDGAYLKLVEDTGSSSASEKPKLLGLANTNMNVSDLERSREFYRLIGFSESTPGAQAGGGEFAAAHGFDHPIEFLGEDISLGADTDGATIQLRQWVTPYDDSPPYPPPVNHLGIDRINFYVKDLTATVKTMNDLGFQQLGPIGGSPEIGIVFFFDPDGIKVQFAGPQSG